VSATTEPRPLYFLYDLLPVIYRQRDLGTGEPMRAIFAIAQAVYQLLEDDIGALGDDWYAETCAPELLPFLGDLVALPRELTVDRPAADLRRLVANVTAYRRGKGTADTLAAIAGDVTGWSVRVVESTRRIARTPNVGVPGRFPGTLDVRQLAALDELGTPFESGVRTVDVRTAATREGVVGAAGIANVGELAVAIWRDVPATYEGVDPWAVAPQCYTFDPLGRDLPLLNPPTASSAYPERTVPGRLANARLRDDLRAGGPAYLGIDPPAFAIAVPAGGAYRPLTADELTVTPLASWRSAPSGTALVDVERGRFVLPTGWGAPRVDATWSDLAALGGGTQHVRGEPLTDDDEVLVARDRIVDHARRRRWYPTLEDALAALAGGAGGAVARVTIADSGTYRAPAGGWVIALGSGWQQIVVDAAPAERPVLIGDLAVRAAGSGTRFVLGGVLLRGTVSVDVASDAVDVACTVEDATIEPADRLAITTSSGTVDLTVTLRGAICGRIRLPEVGARLLAHASIIDGVGAPALAASGEDGPHAELRRCTVFGDVHALAAQLEETIVDGTVQVRAAARSAARYVMVRAASGIDVQYAVRLGRVRFVSQRYGTYGYARLPLHEDPFVLSGAADGGELGAFHALASGRRAANLRSVLDEYVPYGTRTGVFDER